MANITFRILTDITRDLNSCTHQNLADQLDVTYDQYNSWRQGKRKPKGIYPKDVFEACFAKEDTSFALTRFIQMLDERDCFPVNPSLDEFRNKLYESGDYETFVTRVITIALDNSRVEKQKISSFAYLENCRSFIEKEFLPFFPETYGLNEDFEIKYSQYSSLFTCISTLMHNEKELEITSLFDQLYQIIISHKTKAEYVLKLVGSAGTEKNIIMQMLFIRLCSALVSGEQKQFAPFYISLYELEEIPFDNEKSYEDQVRAEIRKALATYKEYCSENPEQLKIIFVDGIRDFEWGTVPIDFYLHSELGSITNRRLFVNVDSSITVNKLRLRSNIPLASFHFSYELKIGTVDLSDRQKAMSYFAYYEPLYGKADHLYDDLVRMNFYSVDTGQLSILHNYLCTHANDETYTISALYETYCEMHFGGNRKRLRKAAQTAFLFAYSDVSFSVTESYGDSIWDLICFHSSFIDFFVSKYYMNNLQSYKDNESPEAFEMILPKTVTRYITPQLNSSASYEEKMLHLIKSQYEKMNLRGKSEMTYWLGRIRTTSLKEEALYLLRKYYKEQKAHIEECATGRYHTKDKKNDLFLLRGIAVSLIYRNEPKVSDEYIHSLIDDDMACSINRGFHLEYYGDKEYLPIHNTLDYEDVLEVGSNTLRQLIVANEVDLAHGRFSPQFELNLFTICSLLQARIEAPVKLKFDIEYYSKQAVDILQNYLNLKRCVDEKINLFFEMMLIDLKKYLCTPKNKRQPVVTGLYNFYSKAPTIKRSGWVSHNIPQPENIIEHIYNAWLIGFMFLPEHYNSEPEYNKQKILNLLLIHDLGECVTGDIEKPKKEESSEYENEEDRIMKSFLLKGTYPTIPNWSQYYDLWQKWHTKENINAQIAKDIDIIQAIYQLCCYLLTYRANFTEKKIKNWINEKERLKSPIGRTIYKKLILENNDFEKLNIGSLLSK